MRICDLKQEDIKVGLRLKFLVSDRQGTIVEVDHNDDEYSWVSGTETNKHMVVSMEPIVNAK